MERLTEEKQIGTFAALKDKAEAVPGAFATYECLYAHMVAVTRLKQYEDAMPLERAQELAQAEKDGRMVVLPCKVGDFVYALWDVPAEYKYVIYCAEIKEVCISARNCRLTITYRLEPIEYRGRRKEYRAEDFGKTVFLTREEAEAALEKRE